MSTISAVLRLNQSVGITKPIQCDGYIVIHRDNQVTLAFPRNEQGVNDTFIINKIRALANIYYDQYGASDSDKFIELFDDLTNYNYYLEPDSHDDDIDVEDMLDYLEQQQDEDDLQQQLEELTDCQNDCQNDCLDPPINVTQYVANMEYLYGANIPTEKDWLIHNEIKSAFPYLTTLHVIHSTLHDIKADYFFDPIANIFTIYIDNNQHYQIIVRYATPFYSIVRFRHFNIPDTHIINYQTHFNMFRQKLLFQSILNTYL